jgi:hypothetical protein
MAKVEAKPYKEGKTWSMRRRVSGQELFVSGKATSAAAKKAMDKRVLALTTRGKPKGLGPHRTTVAQALQDMGLERLPFMKGAQQEANRFNRYLRAAGLATLKVRPWEPRDAELGVPQVNKKGKGQLFVVELEAPVDERRIPRGLAGHRQALSKETAKADAALSAIARMTVADVQPYHVQDFMDALRGASRMPATLQLERAVLRGLGEATSGAYSAPGSITKPYEEREANMFAAALLMPAPLVQHAALEHDLGDELDITALAKTFGVSEQAMFIRLQQLGVVEVALGKSGATRDDAQLSLTV